MNVTHIARDRLGPNGELYRCCDGGPLVPLPNEYTNGWDTPLPAPFCEDCKRQARLIRGGRWPESKGTKS